MTDLVLEQLSVDRDGHRVVRDVSLRAPAGEVTLLLGANGAGKTTVLEAVSGVLPTSSGSITLGGRQITGWSRGRRARAGLGHVQQGRAVFGALSVEGNLAVVAGQRAVSRGLELFPELEQRRSVPARDLSGGEQQMLVIARALAGDPAVLLLDEVSLGLAPIVVHRLLPVVREIADRGVAVLLVEQFAHLALQVGDHAYLMRAGQVVAAAPSRELTDHPELLSDSYLAGQDHTARPSQNPRHLT